MFCFCDTCRRIIDERDMHTDDICSTCHIIGADERRTNEDKDIETAEASPEPAGKVESGPYLPGFAPAQETEGGKP
jgi:hypothetical protein